MKNIYFAIFIIILFCSCKSYKEITINENNIYNYIIMNDISNCIYRDSLKNVCIYNRNTIVKLGLFKNPIKDLLVDSIYFSLLKKIISINSKENIIKPLINSDNKNIKIIIIKRNEKNKINFLEDFSNNYPHSLGLIKFSKPVFTSDYNIAFIYRTKTLGPLSGIGEFFILKKEKNKWKIIYRETMWVS